MVGRIPCLVDDPALWRTLWLRRLDDYTQGIELRVASLQTEAEGAVGASPEEEATPAPPR